MTPKSVARTEENLERCQCMKCTTYTFICKVRSLPGNVVNMLGDIGNVTHMEGMFCSFGESKCIREEKGCICMTCAIYKENDLDKAYYCLGGKVVKM